MSHLLHLDATSLAYCLSFLTLPERFRAGRSCRSTLPAALHPVAWQFSVFNVPLTNLPPEKKYHRLFRKLELLDVLPQWLTTNETGQADDPFALSEFTRVTSLHLGGSFFDHDRRDCYGLLDTESPAFSKGSVLCSGKENLNNNAALPRSSSSILTLTTESYTPCHITPSLARDYTSMPYILSHQRLQNLTCLDYRLELKDTVLLAIMKLRQLRHLKIGEVIWSDDSSTTSADSILSSLTHLESLCITIQLAGCWNPLLPLLRLPGLPPTLKHLDLKIGRGGDAMMSEAGVEEEEQQERMCILGAVLQQCTHPSFSCSLRKLIYDSRSIALVNVPTLRRARAKRNMMVTKFVRGESAQFLELRQRTRGDEEKEKEIMQRMEEEEEKLQHISSYTPPLDSFYKSIGGLPHIGPFPLHLLSHGLTNLELENYAHHHDFVNSFTLGMKMGGCKSLTYLSLRPRSKEDSAQDRRMLWEGISQHTRLRVLVLDFGSMSTIPWRHWSTGSDDVGVEVMTKAGMHELEEVRLLSHHALWSLGAAKMLSTLPHLRKLCIESSGLQTLPCMKQILTSSSLTQLDILDRAISTRALNEQNVGLASLLLQHSHHCRSTLSGWSPSTIVAQVKGSWLKTWSYWTG